MLDDKYFFIKDLTKYRNIHAYDLDGNWLWDIESALDNTGKPEEYFNSVMDKIEIIDGVKWIHIGSFPMLYMTELETGKNTHLIKVFDDTNMK